MERKMIKIITLLVFIFSGIQASGQNLDYKSIRDSLTQLSCGQVDSLTVVKTRTKLETVDTNLISSNIDIYYRDLGWCYYRLYLETKDISFIRMASDSYDKALSHNPRYATVLHDQYFFNYFFYCFVFVSFFFLLNEVCIFCNPGHIVNDTDLVSFCIAP